MDFSGALAKKEEQEFKNFLQTIQEQSSRTKIIFIEVFSICMTILCAAMTAYLAYVDYSMIALAISLDSLIDILAGFVVIWRYLNPNEICSSKRDSKASLLLSILFIITSICIEFESIKNLVNKERPIASGLFILSSVLESVLFSLIAMAKFFLAQNLSVNKALISSGINSLIASLSYFSMAISMSVFVLYPNMWYFDSIFGFWIGIMVFVYGIQLFVKITCLAD
jgi:divalent metal cation (Fe/Co/Zn/Cd) transporter